MTTANLTTVPQVCILFFLPGEDRSWRPGGTTWADLAVDADDLADDLTEAISAAAETWCEAQHGTGSFWGVCLD